VPAFPAGTKLDNFVVAQYASPTILGSGPGDDTYLLSPSLLPAGTTLTLTDTEGNNSIQLAQGLDIASSRVTASALQLTLSNGSVITVLGASQFGYEAGGNRSAGIDGPDLGYADFAQQVLGVTVPTGSVTRSASQHVSPGRILPVTVELRCITWLYRSAIITGGNSMLPGTATRPTSLRPRSTSMMCSARSFGSASSSSSRALSSASVAPRRRVPARGRLTMTPS